MIAEVNLKALREEAERYYLDGDFYCSEAVVAVIRKHFQSEMPVEGIAMASGFPIGIGGAQCICGAVPGGVLCIGYFFGRTAPKDTKVNKAMELSNELLAYFKSKHKVPCCRVHVKDMELGSEVHMKQCAGFTGEAAEKTAEIIARELNIKVVEKEDA